MVLSIVPNYELFLNIIIITWIIEIPFRMFFGITKRAKENITNYDSGDTLNAVLKIATLIVVFIF